MPGVDAKDLSCWILVKTITEQGLDMIWRLKCWDIFIQKLINLFDNGIDIGEILSRGYSEFSRKTRNIDKVHLFSLWKVIVAHMPFYGKVSNTIL